ncbi:MAG: hypothetical protein IPP93_05555 [Chitinophagaceae bacterium]|nr:hypothetical protein [Chitinophagaceae bacterium]
MQKINIKWSGFIAILLMSLFTVSCDKQPIGPTGPDPVGPPAPGQYITLTDFRALYTGGGADQTVPAGTKKFRAQVISNSANEAVGNYRLQDESGSGIILYSVVGSPVYSLGSVLEVDAAGVGIVNLYNGDLELRAVPQAKVVPVNGTLVLTTRTATTAQIVTNKDAWASTLVKITGITSIVQGSTNGTGTNYTINDASGSLPLFVRTASGITVNLSGTSITGYVSIFNSTAQISIRSASDIQ